MRSLRLTLSLLVFVVFLAVSILAGYICKAAKLLENGGAVSYHCGLAETKPALTTTPPDPTPVCDGGAD